MKRELLLIGHGSRNREAMSEFVQLADQVSNQLEVHVETCFLEYAEPPIIDGIQSCIERNTDEIVALPLFLGPAGHQKNDVPAIINWARQRWPEIRFTYGTPVGAQYHIVSLLGDRLAAAYQASAAHLPQSETAVIVGARGSRDPDSNAEVAKLARLIYEGRNYGWVEPAYYSLTQPSIPDVVAQCGALGAQQIILLPYLLFTGRIHDKMVEQAFTAAGELGLRLITSQYLFPHENLVLAIVQRFEEATSQQANMTCDICKYRRKLPGFESEYGLPQTSDHSHGLRGVPHSHGIDEKLAQMLPPRYQGMSGSQVSSSPMTSADLQFDDEGAVAWDNMWQDFCELALAGGPAHRGDLLEPVDPQLIQQNPHGYRTVLNEIERGLKMVSDLPIKQSKAPGWIGLRCTDEEMALWLLRAIVVENVFARREGCVLYLPVGPHYQLASEIKNIVTVVAKTVHYWIEHVSERKAQAGT